MEVEILKRKSGMKKLCKNEGSNNNSYNKNGDTIIGFGNYYKVILKVEVSTMQIR